jgi:hypothetical protein
MIPLGSQPESGAFIAGELDKVVKEIGPGRVLSVTTDHASNMEAAMDALQDKEKYGYTAVEWIPCVCHLLHTVQEHVVNGVAPMRKLMKNLVLLASVITKSSILRQEVESLQKTGSVRAIATVAKTRWGSRFGCIWSLVHARQAITSVFNSDTLLRRCACKKKRLERARVTASNGATWTDAEWMLAFLQPFHTALRTRLI